MNYYDAPTDEQFKEVKEKAIEIWSGYDNQFWYADEKIGAIKDINNISDNFMYIVSMFDSSNQRKLAVMLSDETNLAIRERMVAGGASPDHTIF